MDLLKSIFKFSNFQILKLSPEIDLCIIPNIQAAAKAFY